ncbi:8-oxo-dGDP phosphatase NUDT18 isoform X2 [Lissotriton helveticus]
MAWPMVEHELEMLLDGKGLDEPAKYNVAPEKLKPVKLRKNVTHIVAAVILNEQEVLMIQEAKEECYGKWYLPAGRMELNETIIEAMKREVQEETGLQCEARTLLAVQEHGPSWIRFVFLSEITGGTLKTTKEADSESLQAAWWDRTSTLSIRAPDIHPLIKLALQYHEHPSHPLLMPHETEYSVVSQRFVIIFTSSAEDVWVMMSTQSSYHLPVTACGSTFAESRKSTMSAMKQLLQRLLPEVKVNIKGVLALQHLGKSQAGGADGVCLNVLVSITHSLASSDTAPPGIIGEGFDWFLVPQGTVKSRLLQRLSANAVVPLHS